MGEICSWLLYISNLHTVGKKSNLDRSKETENMLKWGISWGHFLFKKYMQRHFIGEPCARLGRGENTLQTGELVQTI